MGHCVSKRVTVCLNTNKLLLNDGKTFIICNTYFSTLSHSLLMHLIPLTATSCISVYLSFPFFISITQTFLLPLLHPSSIFWLNSYMTISLFHSYLFFNFLFLLLQFFLSPPPSRFPIFSFFVLTFKSELFSLYLIFSF